MERAVRGGRILITEDKAGAYVVICSSSHDCFIPKFLLEAVSRRDLRR